MSRKRRPAKEQWWVIVREHGSGMVAFPSLSQAVDRMMEMQKHIAQRLTIYPMMIEVPDTTPVTSDMTIDLTGPGLADIQQVGLADKGPPVGPVSTNMTPYDYGNTMGHR